MSELLIAEDTSTTKIKTDKNVVHVTQDEFHFGFWKLSLDRGALPSKYRGQYTKRAFAEAAAKEYAMTKTKD